MGLFMRSPSIASLISTLRDLLAEEPILLASQEDADYFRSQWTQPKANLTLKAQPPPLPQPLPKIPPPKAASSPPPIAEKPSPLSSPAPLSFSPLRALFAKIAPEIPILEEIPSDAPARKIANRWKTKNQTAPISILSFGEPKPQKALLEEIAKALDVFFGPARIIPAEPIEKEMQWEVFLSVNGLKLIIACDFALWQLRSLLPFYRENPADGTRTLKNVPLFLLPDLSLYFKDPLLKRLLWKALCQKLSS